MTQRPFPGRRSRGEQPPRPAGPARDGLPGGPAADDWDGDAEMAAFLADLEAGRARVPEPWELEGPAASISLGDAADVDLDALRPGPVLAALTEQAAGELARLSDDRLLGAVAAARRLAARAEYLELSAVAEFTRRRNAQLAAAKA